MTLSFLGPLLPPLARDVAFLLPKEDEAKGVLLGDQYTVVVGVGVMDDVTENESGDGAGDLVPEGVLLGDQYTVFVGVMEDDSDGAGVTEMDRDGNDVELGGMELDGDAPNDRECEGKGV
jgi:hypothetical protein